MYYGVRARLKRLNKQAQERAHSTVSPKVRAEVETELEEYRTRYNSEPEKQKRAAEYAEIQRIGELRKQAFLRGESMDKYPLPDEPTPGEWQTEIERGKVRRYRIINCKGCRVKEYEPEVNTMSGFKSQGTLKETKQKEGE